MGKKSRPIPKTLMLKEESSFHSYLILSSTISTHCLQIVYNVLLLSSLSCYSVSLSLDYFYSFLIYYSIRSLTVMFHFNFLLNHLPFFFMPTTCMVFFSEVSVLCPPAKMMFHCQSPGHTVLTWILEQSVAWISY